MTNDTIHGAETLALYYSLYKTSQMNGLDFIVNDKNNFT